MGGAEGMAFWAVRTLVIQEDQSWDMWRESGLRLPRQGGAKEPSLYLGKRRGRTRGV